MKKISSDNYVFYLTKECQGLYLGNKLIKTVEEVQGKGGIRWMLTPQICVLT